MALIQYFRKQADNPVEINTISNLNINGHHAFTDGSSADTVTDERLQQGDEVITIKDNTGHKFIVAGRR